MIRLPASLQFEQVPGERWHLFFKPLTLRMKNACLGLSQGGSDNHLCQCVQPHGPTCTAWVSSRWCMMLHSWAVGLLSAPPALHPPRRWRRSIAALKSACQNLDLESAPPSFIFSLVAFAQLLLNLPPDSFGWCCDWLHWLRNILAYIESSVSYFLILLQQFSNWWLLVFLKAQLIIIALYLIWFAIQLLSK